MRSLKSKLIPAIGGILTNIGSPYTYIAEILIVSIKDIGFGKTLSVLALVYSSLDFNSITISYSKNIRY